MDVFPLFTAKAWRKNGVEAIEHDGEILINQGILEKKTWSFKYIWQNSVLFWQI